MECTQFLQHTKISQDQGSKGNEGKIFSQQITCNLVKITWLITSPYLTELAKSFVVHKMIKTLWKTRLRSCANCHAMCIIRLTREGPSVRSRAPHTNILSYEEVSDDFETVEMKGRSLVPTPACKRYQKVESNVSYVPLGWPIGCGLGIALFQRATVFLFPRRAKRCE